jgi:hypothetical protein
LKNAYTNSLYWPILGEVDGLLQQRLDPPLQLLEHVHLRVPPAGLRRLDHRALPLLVRPQVGLLVREELPDIRDRMGHPAVLRAHLGDRARQQDHPVVVPEPVVVVHEDLLVREDVALVAEDVVELPQTFLPTRLP